MKRQAGGDVEEDKKSVAPAVLSAEDVLYLRELDRKKQESERQRKEQDAEDAAVFRAFVDQSKGVVVVDKSSVLNKQEVKRAVVRVQKKKKIK
jgi:hypothetical protein